MACSSECQTRQRSAICHQQYSACLCNTNTLWRYSDFLLNFYRNLYVVLCYCMMFYGSPSFYFFRLENNNLRKSHYAHLTDENCKSQAARLQQPQKYLKYYKLEKLSILFIECISLMRIWNSGGKPTHFPRIICEHRKVTRHLNLHSGLNGRH